MQNVAQQRWSARKQTTGVLPPEGQVLTEGAYTEALDVWYFPLALSLSIDRPIRK